MALAEAEGPETADEEVDVGEDQAVGVLGIHELEEVGVEVDDSVKDSPVVFQVNGQVKYVGETEHGDDGLVN